LSYWIKNYTEIHSYRIIQKYTHYFCIFYGEGPEINTKSFPSKTGTWSPCLSIYDRPQIVVCTS